MFVLILACTPDWACEPGQGVVGGECVDLAVETEEAGLDGPSDTAPSEDTSGDSAVDTSGDSGGDIGGDSGGDSGEDTGLATNPFAGTADIDGHGTQKDCDYWRMPCFQNVVVALREGDTWTFVEAPVVHTASVPDPIMVPRIHEGEPWWEIRIYYQDANTDNHPERETTIAFASLAFPQSELVDVDSAVKLLGEEAGYRWVHRATDVHEVDENVVDPSVEAIEDGDDLLWMVFALQSSEGTGEGDPDSPDTGWFPEDSLVFLSTSTDGVSFTLKATVATLGYEDGTIGSDQDPFPLGFDGTYPRPLPAEYGPGGSGQWGLHVSQGDTVMRWTGDLDGMSLQDAEAMHNISVTTTSILGGLTTVYGSKNLGSYDDEGASAELVSYSLDDQGYHAGPLVLSPEKVKEAALGVFSPTMLPLIPDAGIELLVYSAYKEAWED